MNEKKHITIIGGGMGGLALGQALLKHPNLNFTIYERDESISHRSQGYQISVHDYGVKALQSLQLNGFDALMQENPIEGIMILQNNDLIPYVKLPKADGSLVNRFKLRDLLLQNLLSSSPSTSSSPSAVSSVTERIIFNKRFKHYEILPNQKLVVSFEDNTSIETDFLVGADGVNSRVCDQFRPDLPFQPIRVNGIAGFFPIETQQQKEKIPSVCRYLQNTLVRIQLQERQSLLIMRFLSNEGIPHLLWIFTYDVDYMKEIHGKDLLLDITGEKEEEEEKEEKESLQTDARKTESSENGVENGSLLNKQLKVNLLNCLKGKDYSLELIECIERTSSECLFQQRGYVSLVPNQELLIPTSESNPSFGVVTLLGDAAHAMTSHAGLGANTAFMDAIELAKYLSNSEIGIMSNRWNEGYSQYEKEMFSRGYQAVSASLENTRKIHSDISSIRTFVLNVMGIGMKTWNYFQTGNYDF
jgi:2-polyprenyl-6-methoxyphenol hydroxylase-like FAD-dependent oxidoreductase